MNSTQQSYLRQFCEDGEDDVTQTCSLLMAWLYIRLKLEASWGMNSYKITICTTVLESGFGLEYDEQWLVLMYMYLKFKTINSLQRLYDGNWAVYVGYGTYFFQKFDKNLEKQRETLSDFGRKEWPWSMSYPPWPMHDRATSRLSINFTHILKMKLIIP